MVSSARKRKLAKEAAEPTPEPAERVRGGVGQMWEGMTCLEAARAQADEIGGLPTEGSLYRVGLLQGSEDGQGLKVGFIGDYRGVILDPKSGGEFAYTFMVLNPADLQGDGPDGAFVVLPIDVWHLSPAQAGDLDAPLATRTATPLEQWRIFNAPRKDDKPPD